MYCTSCGKEIADNSKFCYLCGARQADSRAAAAAVASSDYTETGARKLRRSSTDKVFGGVCGGLGAFFDIDPVLLRVIWAILAVSGIGILAYIICWVVIDEERPGARPVQAAPVVVQEAGPRRLRRSADAKWAGVCGGIAEHFGLDATLVRLLTVLLSIFLGAVVGGLIVYFVLWLVMPPPEPRSAGASQPVAHSS